MARYIFHLPADVDVGVMDDIIRDLGYENHPGFMNRYLIDGVECGLIKINTTNRLVMKNVSLHGDEKPLIDLFLRKDYLKRIK